MSIVSNVRVYDLDETLKASGLPMNVEGIDYTTPVSIKDTQRTEKLIKASLGGDQAHCQFLSGIVVNFDLTFSNKAWCEAERYKFLTFISSQSTMHRIAKFDLSKSYNKYVDSRIIDIVKGFVDEYNKNPTPENYLKILYNNPAGFMLTARLSTNYRCLRNIYKQRKNHRLPEWREFCKWMETLPYADKFIIN